MAISRAKAQVIADNPNLSSSALARFLGINIKTVIANREKTNWKHDGKTIPFLSTVNHDGLRWFVQHGNRKIHRGSFKNAIKNVDRLIYCLENNKGQLPPYGVEDWSLSGLKFIRELEYE